ncbi:glycine oxidase ThiO [Myxosarcina sp. GI1]|uniref:glycine oxidase ThiO n=1 Tax=Myxosarcina sp. GI1 TaxID=1541065 RepID=UPI00056A658A|nr:glycine oxidase ThiO [Myxosarcina sp. GI1]
MKAAEIVVVGGGIVGLAIAIELKRRGADVMVVSRNSSEAAANAAAGMLAPMAEQIDSEPMRELCLRSRDLYPEWIGKLEELTGIDTGYLPRGILAPVYTQPSAIETARSSIWLDETAIRHYQSGLGKDVVGGWWHPEDGQVDNRALMRSLLQAARTLGIELKEGVTVKAIRQQQGRVASLVTDIGNIESEQYVIAAGSWISQLLPLPVRPVKGQMLALKMPPEIQPLSQQVLFGEDVYLVPRLATRRCEASSHLAPSENGRLIVGATVEEISWTPGNTAQGIQSLLNKATRLYPALAPLQIEELWWGFRPGTPDELPILGRGSCDNLFLATGHYRNGILLAPITARIMADLISEQKADPLLKHFSYLRFQQIKVKSQKLEVKSMLELQSNGTSPQQISLPATTEHNEDLVIAGRTFQSRLMTGTGKYPSIEAMQQSIAASGCQIVTVAVRRVQTKAAGHEGLAEAIDWSKIWMLPNTAGCKTSEEAIRVARLGREMAKLLGQEDNNFVKLEVIPDAKYLLPDPIGTLEAAEKLVKEGFAVLPYINADPLLAKRLEEVGCATVMPLGSPIGSGQGIKNAANIQIIIEEANVPVVVDAGIGLPSEAAYSMELGADALLVNSAIALAKNPPAMAQAMGMATVAGRLAYLAGRIPIKQYASASSPLTGTIDS